MIRGLAAFILLRTVCLIQTAGVPHEITSIELELGGSANFSCPSFQKEHRFIQWYKQPLGKIIQTIASGIYSNIKLFEPFNNKRFQVHRKSDEMILFITSVKKEDEAIYLCQSGTEFSQNFIKGFFLTIKDCNQPTAVYVKQTSDTTAVRPGDSTTLQCSLHSSQETNTQCPESHRVHWIRAGSGNSFPSIIYTQRNITDENTVRSCVYRLSKTLQDSSDFGTYYCVVVTCGEILFGNGTKLETRAELDPLVFVLGGLLFCCLALNFLLVYKIQRRTSDHFEGTIGAPQGAGQGESTADQSDELDTEANIMKYTALDFSATNVRHLKKKENNICVYSSVRANSQNQQL